MNESIAGLIRPLSFERAEALFHERCGAGIMALGIHVPTRLPLIFYPEGGSFFKTPPIEDTPQYLHPAVDLAFGFSIRPLVQWRHGFPEEIIPVLYVEKNAEDREVAYLDGHVDRFLGLNVLIRMFVAYGDVESEWWRLVGVRLPPKS